jgi:alpha-L-rhamnosidase
MVDGLLKSFTETRVPMKLVSILACALVLSASVRWAHSAVPAGAPPTSLRCESMLNPLAVEAPQPRLTWKVDAGQTQKAYRILVASSPALLQQGQGDLWDSGRVASDETLQIPYAGKPLSSRQHAYWQVTRWNDKDVPAAETATFSMGLLKASDWQAKWIAFPNDASQKVMEPDPCFRKEFSITRPIARAIVHICGLGQYEMTINGQRVGDNYIAPGWSVYQKTCLYDSYDVTSQLKPGANAVGIMLGNGMYNVLKVANRYTKNNNTWGFPKVIMEMDLEYADGTRGVVVTDDSWKTIRGPMLVDQEYGGEDYDARKDMAGWDSPGFNDQDWTPVALTVAPGDQQALATAKGAGPGTAQLVAAINPPTKIQKVFKPANVTQTPDGCVYDFGQNLSGWPHFKVKGPAGATIKLIPGETTGRSGVSQSSSGSPMWYSYILKGGGEEEWRPKFMYYGFRYVQVQGAKPAGDAADSSLPQITEMTSEWLYADAPLVGHFASSDTTLNRIHALIDGAIVSNMQSVLTDCPHREKLGWLEQSHLMAEAISANYDVSNLYAKICKDVRDAQLDNGMIASIAPQYVVFGPKDPTVPAQGFDDSPEWGSAGVIDAWHVYQTYGDLRTLEAQYDTMKKYVAYLGSRSADNIVSHGLGDWFDIGPKGAGTAQLTTKALTATATYFQDIEIVRKTAELLHKTDDVKTYSDLSAKVRAAFTKQFFDPATAQYEKGSQTANAMPLVVGLVDPQDQAKVLANLVAEIRGNGNHITAGDVGFSYVVKTLTDAQQGEVMYDMTVNPTGPGYVAQLKSGATTLTEGWDGSSSRNHLMLGHAEAWFYRGLGGIQNAPGSIAFKHVVIRPEVVEKLASEGPTKWVKVSFDSPRGLIVSNWELSGKKLTMNVTVPPTVTADIYVPAADPAKITVTGTLVLPDRKTESKEAVFTVPAGSYTFTTTLP